MRQQLFPTLLTLVIALTVNSCGFTLKVPIDKNKLTSNVTIKFNQKDLTIKQNDVFLLSEKGFESNKIKQDNSLYKITEINYAIKQFKKNKYVNYDITITNPKYAKPYYGKIAFFNTNKNHEVSAVARYRELSIDDSYFASATRGRVAIMYEYSENNVSLIRGAAKVPTWIILMSDEPF